MQHERTKDKRFLDAYQYAIDLNGVLHSVLRARAVSGMFIFNSINNFHNLETCGSDICVLSIS
jgi:hypothetical protein